MAGNFTSLTTQFMAAAVWILRVRKFSHALARLPPFDSRNQFSFSCPPAFDRQNTWMKGFLTYVTQTHPSRSSWGSPVTRFNAIWADRFDAHFNFSHAKWSFAIYFAVPPPLLRSSTLVNDFPSFCFCHSNRNRE